MYGDNLSDAKLCEWHIQKLLDMAHEKHSAYIIKFIEQEFPRIISSGGNILELGVNADEKTLDVRT